MAQVGSSAFPTYAASCLRLFRQPPDGQRQILAEGIASTIEPP